MINKILDFCKEENPIGCITSKFLETNGINYHVVDTKLLNTIKKKYIGPITNMYFKQRKMTNVYNLCESNHNLLSSKNYNHNININDADYVILDNLKIEHSLDNSKLFVTELLKKILDKKIINDNNKIITMDQIVIQDYLVSNTLKQEATRFAELHTDFNWMLFDKSTKGFQIWYLIENNEDYGNMFLYETNEIKEYPYIIDNYDETTHKSKLIKNNIMDNLLNYTNHFDEIYIDFTKFKYLNIKNGECLVMSKHQPHSTDLRRDNKKKFIALNFRVIIKNEDGSIDLNPSYSNTYKVKNMQYKNNNKLYGVDIFDFF
jgi:hypothetical protein